MKKYSTSPLTMVRSLWQNRSLLVAMVRRDVLGRYRGSFLGLIWSTLTPLIMLGIYTFVFSVVFQARWGGTDGGYAGFAMTMFVGMLVHGLFSECIAKAPSIVTANVNFVKKIVFPLEILPLVPLGSALFHLLVNILVLLAFQLASNGSLPPTAVLLPVVLLPLALTTMGVAWFLSALGVYLRDIGHVTGMVSLGLLFLSPVFYPVTALPPEFQPWLLLNPLTSIIEDARDVLLAGKTPSIIAWSASTTVSVIIAWAGYAWFQKTRTGFADVL